VKRSVVVGLIVVGVFVLIVGASALFTVHQASQALVLQFGRPVRVVKAAGLHVKTPFIQNVLYFDRRVLDFDAAAEEVIASDQKRLVVDAFARYRIIDPLRFFQAQATEARLRSNLGRVINSATRRVLGGVPLSTIVSGERAKIMTEIRDIVNVETKSWGIAIIDVRIKRADLPEENSQAIFRRMQTERVREAKEFRARGAEEAQRIRAAADREKVVIIAEAQKEAQITRGKGDSDAIRIYADAFNQDPGFFAFYRTMQAYKKALSSSDTSMVLTPDSEFFRYFRELGNAGKPR